MNGGQLLRDLHWLSDDDMQGRETGQNQKSRDYLQQRFVELDIRPFGLGYLQAFNINSGADHNIGVNVLGWLPARDFAVQQYIVITAHYDHLGRRGKNIYNGADDNASGVAAMLAIAQNIKVQPLNVGVIFVATDAEELGLFGAQAFVDNPPIPLQQVLLNINLDMIANSGRRKRLYLASSKPREQLQPIVNSSVDNASVCLVSGHNGISKSHSGFRQIDWRKSSDHAVFNRADIPYLFFSVNDHSVYHTENDTADRINPRFYQAAVETIWMTVQKAASSL